MSNNNEIPSPPQYKIILHNGQESPVLTQTEIYEYARTGFIKPETLVYDVSARIWGRADAIPPILVVLRQTGRLHVPPPMPEPPRPQHPQGYQGQAQMQSPQAPQMQAQYGQPGVIQYPPGSHNPGGAILCGFLIVGVGQMVNHQVIKGVVIMLAALCLGVFTAGVATLIIWLFAFIDTICIANRLNRGEPVREWQFF
jgi:hypothetical protein